MDKYERETIINWNMAENTATIYSCQESVWSKCRKACYKELEDEIRKDERGRVISNTFACPKKCISLRKVKVVQVFP